jgi:hypothetical protein
MVRKTRKTVKTVITINTWRTHESPQIVLQAVKKVWGREERVAHPDKGVHGRVRRHEPGLTKRTGGDQMGAVSAAGIPRAQCEGGAGRLQQNDVARRGAHAAAARPSTSIVRAGAPCTERMCERAWAACVSSVTSIPRTPLSPAQAPYSVAARTRGSTGPSDTPPEQLAWGMHRRAREARVSVGCIHLSGAEYV